MLQFLELLHLLGNFNENYSKVFHFGTPFAINLIKVES